MIRNPNNKNSYSEEYDIDGLREILEMAKLYVSKENGFKGKGRDVPDGTYSDFSCAVWSLFVEAIHYGILIDEKKGEVKRIKLGIESAEKVMMNYKEKLEKFDFNRPDY